LQKKSKFAKKNQNLQKKSKFAKKKSKFAKTKIKICKKKIAEKILITNLETSTLISKLSNAVKDKVNNFFANGVMTTSVVISGVLLTSYKLFRMKQLAISSSSNFINYSRLQIDKNGSRNMLTFNLYVSKWVLYHLDKSFSTWHVFFPGDDQ